VCPLRGNRKQNPSSIAGACPVENPALRNHPSLERFRWGQERMNLGGVSGIRKENMSWIEKQFP
jgi:hypothetical protein